MSAIVRSFRRSGPFQLAALALALGACATAVEDLPDDNGGGNQPATGGSGGASVTGAGTNSGAGTPPVTSGGKPPMGGGGQVSGGGMPAAAGTAPTTAGTTATGGTAGTCPPYAGALAKDSTIFTGGFGKATTGTWSGYGYTYKYGTATIAPGMGNSCFAGMKFCANGNVPAADTSGAGLGWNIGQAMGAATSTPVAITTPVKLTFAGVVAGMRVQLSESATVSYCYTLTAAEATAGTATIPLASFKTECWGTTGVAYAGTPIEAIQVAVPGSAAAAQNFDICVLDIEPG